MEKRIQCVKRRGPDVPEYDPDGYQKPRGFDLFVKCVIVCAVFQNESGFVFYEINQLCQESARFSCLDFRNGVFFTKLRFVDK